MKMIFEFLQQQVIINVDAQHASRSINNELLLGAILFLSLQKD